MAIPTQSMTTHLKAAVDTAKLTWQLVRLLAPSRRRHARHPSEDPSAGRSMALLAWSLPPSTNAGVHRPLSWLRYGASFGWSIDAFHGPVSAAHSAHGDELLASIHPSAKMHLVVKPDREPFYRLFPRVDGGFKNALAFADAVIAKYRSRPPTAVVASGPPFHTFVAARLVASHFRVPYVLDYRDEWSECPFDFVDNDGNDRWWEAWCLKRASRVIFTTESHRSHQLRTFSDLKAEQTIVIPNGWEPADFDLQETSAFLGDQQEVVLAHVGTLSDHTPISPLLKLVEALNSQTFRSPQTLRVRLVGRRSEAVDAEIQASGPLQRLECVGQVGKREATREMASCSVLLLISSPSLERYLPGKLFDYIAARRPILVLGSEGESSRLVKELNVGVYCAGQSAQDFLDAILECTRLDLETRRPFVDEWLKRHERKALAGAFFTQLDLATQRSSARG